MPESTHTSSTLLKQTSQALGVCYMRTFRQTKPMSSLSFTDPREELNQGQIEGREVT